MPLQIFQYFGNGRKFRGAIFMADRSSQHPHIAIIAKCLRLRMTSHGTHGGAARQFRANLIAEQIFNNLLEMWLSALEIA